MNDVQEQPQENSMRFVFLGAILGALTGAGAGFILARRLEEGEEIQLTAGDGIKLGGSLIAFLKQVSSLGK